MRPAAVLGLAAALGVVAGWLYASTATAAPAPPKKTPSPIPVPIPPIPIPPFPIPAPPAPPTPPAPTPGPAHAMLQPGQHVVVATGGEEVVLAGLPITTVTALVRVTASVAPGTPPNPDYFAGDVLGYTDAADGTFHQLVQPFPVSPIPYASVTAIVS